MSRHETLSRERMAQLVVQDIEPHSYVNLGIGIPTLVADQLDAQRGVILHSENGILGMCGLHADEVADPDLMNATKEPVMLLPGSSITDHVVSFCMMRGGHVDLTVLGAFQVSAQGDLANWDTGLADSIPAVGGAMDLVAGARRIFVMMPHQGKDGSPKIVAQCSYPLTGARVVDRIYTDLSIIDVLADGLVVRGIVQGMTLAQLQERTGVQLRCADDCVTLQP